MSDAVGARYGFEIEDVRQEGAIGILMAERCKPGDRLAGKSRAKARIGRHRKKERDWKNLKIQVRQTERSVDGLQYEYALVHEILDLIPYTLKDEALIAMLEGDGRDMRRIGRLIREQIPGIDKD
jgi:hypothetical protein